MTVVSTCEQCKGTGVVQPLDSSEDQRGNQSQPQECPKCNGRGYLTSTDGVEGDEPLP